MFNLSLSTLCKEVTKHTSFAEEMGSCDLPMVTPGTKGEQAWKSPCPQCDDRAGACNAYEQPGFIRRRNSGSVRAQLFWLPQDSGFGVGVAKSDLGVTMVFQVWPYFHSRGHVPHTPTLPKKLLCIHPLRVHRDPPWTDILSLYSIHLFIHPLTFFSSIIQILWVFSVCGVLLCMLEIEWQQDGVGVLWTHMGRMLRLYNCGSDCWVHILALTFSSVTPGKLLNFSVPQVPCLYNGDIMVLTSLGFGRLNNSIIY